MNTLEITAVDVRNYKRIRELRIDAAADRHLLLIAGNNAAGKSSLMDALSAALGGKDEIVAAVKVGLDRLWPECKPLTIEWAEMNVEKELLYVAWLRGEWQKQPTTAEREVAADVFLAGDWTSKGVIGMEAAVNSAYEAVNWIHARHGWKPVSFQQVPLG